MPFMTTGLIVLLAFVGGGIVSFLVILSMWLDG
jgi:hypothetical protein